TRRSSFFRKGWMRGSSPRMTWRAVQIVPDPLYSAPHRTGAVAPQIPENRHIAIAVPVAGQKDDPVACGPGPAGIAGSGEDSAVDEENAASRRPFAFDDMTLRRKTNVMMIDDRS